MAIALPAGTLARSRVRLLSLPKSATDADELGRRSRLVSHRHAVAVAVPVISRRHDPLVPAGMPLQAPGKGGFLLGTDAIGRDILSRVLFGVRASWFAALVVVAVGLLIGGLVGLIAGAAGGWVDSAADADHRRLPLAARPRAGHRRRRRPRTRIRAHADRGVDRLVAVLRETGAR